MSPTADPSTASLSSSVQPGARKFQMPGQHKYDSLEDERQGRKERLAAAYRIFGKLGLSEGVAGHLTYRDPIKTDHYWVTPFGKAFELMTASDLLLVDPKGNVVMGGKPENQIVNSAALCIHHAIHTARPDLNAACHSHTIHGKAFASLGRNITFTTQDSLGLYGQVAHYDNFGGVVLADEEGERIAKCLGDKGTCVIMQSHGLLTAGSTIEAAVSRFIQLDAHCHVELLADAAAAARGTKPIVIGHEEAEFSAKQIGTEIAAAFQAKPYFDLIEHETKGAYKA